MQAPLKILVIDDDAANQAVVEAVMAPSGAMLFHASDGQEGLARIKELDPDIVILDVMMPGMDGFEVCREIRRRPAQAHIPVLIVTALNDRDTRMAAYDAGADDYITKPLQAAEFRARVRNVATLNRYRMVEASNRRLNGLVRARTAALSEANELLESYSSFVAHDLRTPLALIKGYMSFLLEQPDMGPERRGEQMRRIYSAVGDLENLITDLLSLVHGPLGRRHGRSEDLMPTFRRMVAFFEGHTPRLQGCIVVEELPRLAVSPLLIERVFHNLIGNAVKVVANRESPSIRIGHRMDRKRHCLFIEDNGGGFGGMVSSELFSGRKAAREISAGEGVGIGLSLVRSLLRRHGHGIRASERRGVGARFEIILGQESAGKKRA